MDTEYYKRKKEETQRKIDALKEKLEYYDKQYRKFVWKTNHKKEDDE